MIIRNATKTAVLTHENSAGQRRVVANDHPDPTTSRPPRARQRRAGLSFASWPEPSPPNLSHRAVSATNMSCFARSRVPGDPLYQRLRCALRQGARQERHALVQRRTLGCLIDHAQIAIWCGPGCAWSARNGRAGAARRQRRAARLFRQGRHSARACGWRSASA